MKRVFMIMVCLLSLVSASTGLKAQEISILLRPGWNMIGYPYPETVNLETAFGDFEPMAGDMIESSFGYSEYTSELEWFGEVTSLRPGWGYLYYSNRTEAVTIVFSHPSTPVGSVTVTTSEPMLITAISAMCGGEVTVSDGTYILVKGLCWATHENPTTNDDFYEEAESGVGTFSISMTELNIATTYYVRAYAVTPNGTVYGDQKTFTTRDGIPAVSTMEVTEISVRSAVFGGTTDNGGLNVTARGVCWSTMPNPTIEDNYATIGSGSGSFSRRINGLTISTTYYVRAFASTSQGTGYGEEVSFTTQSSSVGQYVDLGLPSGLLWAICDVGADSPEEYGDYFAWGETQPKTSFDWSNYIYCNGSNQTLTKYCNRFNYGYDGFIDNLFTLLPDDDAATSNWGTEWRTPTHAEWLELFNNTTRSFDCEFGEPGVRFTSNNGGSIFLPLRGVCDSEEWGPHGWSEGYWSSSVRSTSPDCAWDVQFNSYEKDFNGGGLDYIGDFSIDDKARCFRHLVRAVRSSGQTYTIGISCSPSDGGVLNGGDTYWEGQSCTVSAQAYAGYTFINWTENGEEVCTDANYSFVVNGNRNLVANFTYNGGSVVLIGAIDAKFTINGNGDQVYFSQGNLQYIGSAATPYWKFADNQWDVLGTSTGQNSNDQNVDRDLFGWGTSGYNHGANCYQPWSASTSYSDYYAYGHYTYNLYDRTGKADWGYNPISNGGNQTNQWRTLTQQEWSYVFNTRITPSGIRYAMAKVNNVNGVILLPDDWSSGTYSLSNTNNSGASYSSNTITASQWSTLEQAGAVFLPAAGRRSGSSVFNVGGGGGYWSAEFNYSNYAVGVYFDGSSLSMGSINRSSGRSVRLARSSGQNTSFIINTTSSPSEGGTVTGSGIYHEGQCCTVTATANVGYPFTNWTENGEVVSTENPYTFIVTGDRDLVANFATSGSGTAPTGAIDGRFTINASGDQVYFSQGNLQYIGSASTPYWKFADNQWDVLGTTTGQNSTNQSVDRDLFGWGTSGWNNGNTYYRPWDTNNSSGSSYGPPGSYNLKGSYANADWGVYNPISNGGNQANLWRTLTQPEWAYIFNTRTTSSGIRYAMAKVNNVNGVILLPDDWSSDTYSLNNTNSTGASFSSNTISASQWNTLEQAGAVFLPAAGYRYGTSVISVGSYGVYWSASYGNSNYARSVYFYVSHLSTDYSDNRYYGFSVRVVRLAEN